MKARRWKCCACGAFNLSPPPEQQYLDRIAELEELVRRVVRDGMSDVDGALLALGGALARVDGERGQP